MSRRILVVDDDLVVRECMQELLSREGFEVEVAASGEEGLEKVRAKEFDRIMTDCQMPPGMNGTQFAEEVRKLYPFMPIVMMTGRPDIPPVTVVVKKPFHMDDIKMAIALAGRTMGE